MDEKVMDGQGILREVVSRKEALERGLGRYFTGKKCKRRHLSERDVKKGDCLSCRKECKKEYYQENKNKIIEQTKEYQKENKDKVKEYQKEYMKEYRRENKDKIEEYRKEYYQENKDNLNARSNKYRRERYANDPDYKISKICRNMLKRTLKATPSTKNSRTYEALGYCNEELKQNIESKFLENMSWDNYGDWHIDHKYPISRYIQDGTTDPAVINALDNLIPMWDDHNMSKSSMTLEEFLEQEESLAEIYGEFLEAE